MDKATQPAAQVRRPRRRVERQTWLRRFADIIEGIKVSPWARLSRNRWAIIQKAYQKELVFNEKTNLDTCSK